MRVQPGVAAPAQATACRTLVGGFGRPGWRDLDFGEKFVRYAQALDWPPGVVVEDLSCAAHLVLHRLLELRPAKVVLVGAVARGLDAPGTIRRHRLGPAPLAAEDVHAYLAEAVGGEVDLDHTLAVVGHWGGLPPDSVLVEVEAADSSFGLGFSEELAGAMDPLLALIRDEVGDHASDNEEPALAAALDPVIPPSPASAPGATALAAAFPGTEQLFDYAQAHAQTRALQALGQRLPPVPGLAMAARYQPAGGVARTSGDWYDVVGLGDGVVGVVVGDVAGRGVQAGWVMAQLRTAVRAFALVEGDSPARVVEHLDRLVEVTDVGEATTLVYLTVDGRSGEIVLSNAGHGPPLLVTPGGMAEFMGGALSAPLGALGGRPKPQMALRLVPGSTLLLFSDGLVESRSQPLGDGLRQLRRAVANGPSDLEALCDHVVAVCLGSQPADDDVSLLAVRFEP